MTPDQYAIAFYFLFWIVRIRGMLRRGRAPMRRGHDWFFSVRVPADFYDGAGRAILRRYWMRLLIPLAFDIPLAIAIFLSGRYWLLNFLILLLCAVIHVNQLFSVDLAERQARAFALPQEPVAVALSLETRRLSDYTNRLIEAAIILVNAGVFAWLVRYYATTPQASLRRVFASPILILYLEAGLLFVKSLVVAWRSPAPRDDADEYMSARERLRRFNLQMCDLGRVSMAAALLLVPVKLTVSRAAMQRVWSGWFVWWLVVSVALSIWSELRRRQLIVHRVSFPDLQRSAAVARPLFCFEPSAPLLMMRSANGLSVNLANPIAQAGFLYLAGLIALFAILPKPN